MIIGLGFLDFYGREWYNMSVFEKLTEEVTNFLKRSAGGLPKSDWVEWVAEQNLFYDQCDIFNGCWFHRTQMPKYPQHEKCKCSLAAIPTPIPNITAFAMCDIRKFSEYIFDVEKSRGKTILFELWGYNVADSEFLQQLYITQAIQKYCAGQYVYKGAGMEYTRAEIIIDIPDKTGGAQHIKSGWCIMPQGTIKLATPFSGYAEED